MHEPAPIGEPAYDSDDEVAVGHGWAQSDIGPDADLPGLYLPSGRGWQYRELPPPRPPLGFRPCRPTE